MIRLHQHWDTRPPSRAVIEAIAEAENEDPTNLDVALYEHIDPDAIDALVTHRRDRNVVLTVTGERYQVQIDGDTLMVEPLGETSDSDDR